MRAPQQQPVDGMPVLRGHPTELRFARLDFDFRPRHPDAHARHELFMYYNVVMARSRRIVFANIPHHVTQRGNRRQKTFFSAEDYIRYKDIMRQSCEIYDAKILAYCLMPNHIHLIVTPSSVDSLKNAIGEAHQKYTRMINFRQKWQGHLWQGRFFSCAMDDRYLISTAKYIELNPVRARLVEKPEDYPWSSAMAHLFGLDDDLIKGDYLLKLVPDWSTLLNESIVDEEFKTIKQCIRTGRPSGTEDFLNCLERTYNIRLIPLKPGPKPKKSIILK